MKNEAIARKIAAIRLSDPDPWFVKNITETIQHAQFSKKLEKAIQQSCAAEVHCDDFFYLDDVEYLTLSTAPRLARDRAD
jgi:hypothetical protein